MPSQDSDLKPHNFYLAPDSVWAEHGMLVLLAWMAPTAPSMAGFTCALGKHSAVAMAPHPPKSYQGLFTCNERVSKVTAGTTALTEA